MIDIQKIKDEYESKLHLLSNKTEIEKVLSKEDFDKIKEYV